MVVFGQSGCIRAKVDLIGQGGFNREKRLYSGKGCCIRAKIVVFGQ